MYFHFLFFEIDAILKIGTIDICAFTLQRLLKFGKNGFHV
jgi:hypothetical protein